MCHTYLHGLGQVQRLRKVHLGRGRGKGIASSIQEERVLEDPNSSHASNRLRSRGGSCRLPAVYTHMQMCSPSGPAHLHRRRRGQAQTVRAAPITADALHDLDVVPLAQYCSAGVGAACCSNRAGWLGARPGPACNVGMQSGSSIHATTAPPSHPPVTSLALQGACRVSQMRKQGGSSPRANRNVGPRIMAPAAGRRPVRSVPLPSSGPSSLPLPGGEPHFASPAAASASCSMERRCPGAATACGCSCCWGAAAARLRCLAAAAGSGTCATGTSSPAAPAALDCGLPRPCSSPSPAAAASADSAGLRCAGEGGGEQAGRLPPPP